MHRRSRPLRRAALTIVGLACAADSGPGVHAPTVHLGRGINLGNKLEAPSEGEWGAAVGYTLGSVVLCLAAVAIGYFGTVAVAR